MFCLSKGLSAPAGSMLVANRERIDFGRRLRKALGGGMRQVGVLAAPGIIALTEMVDRLKDDHVRAKKLAREISGLRASRSTPRPSRRHHHLWFEHPAISVPAMPRKDEGEGHSGPGRPRGIRMVTHKDVGDEDVDRAVKAFKDILAK